MEQEEKKVYQSKFEFSLKLLCQGVKLSFSSFPRMRYVVYLLKSFFKHANARFKFFSKSYLFLFFGEVSLLTCTSNRSSYLSNFYFVIIHSLILFIIACPCDIFSYISARFISTVFSISFCLGVLLVCRN